MKKNIIEVKNFTKKYANFTAVNDISFSVEEGTIFAFLGPNGAGKSTTINTLCTIFDKTEGTMLIDGYDIVKQKDKVRSSIGVVFQESTLDVKMTLEENLKMHCNFYDVPKDKINERIDYVLTVVDLQEWKKKIVGTLSGGMKRRVEIARSLLHTPKVLFLDEPTTGLDPQTRSHMWDYIVKLQKENGMTIFLTTHYMDEAEVCEKIAIMDNGKIVAIDSPHNLKERYTDDKAYITTKDSDKLEKLLSNMELSFVKKDEIYNISIDKIEDLLAILEEHREYILDMEMKKGTLNDVFLEITGKDIRE